MPDPIRIAVVGGGAFGRNHIRVLQDLSATRNLDLSSRPADAQSESAAATPEAPVHLAAAVDPNPDARALITATYGIPTFATLDELLAANLGLHAATVAVPTVHHAQVATQLLEADLDVLVEKPLTVTLAEADVLVALARQKGRILAAGHLERFNPAVTAALGRLTRPMFFEAHRLSIFTPRSLDVDVVLDLMIHDLDILLTMTRQSALPSLPSTSASLVSEVRAVGLPVLSRNVDIANVRLEFISGAVANLTASRVSTEQVRKLRLFQPAQYLSLDYARQELLTIHVDPSLTHPRGPTAARTFSASPQAPTSPSQPEQGAARESAAPSAETESHTAAQHSPPAAAAPAPSQPHPSAGLQFEKSTLPRTEPLRLELEDFLNSVRTRVPPRVSGSAARDALALALEINAAIGRHTARAHL